MSSRLSQISPRLTADITAASVEQQRAIATSAAEQVAALDAVTDPAARTLIQAAISLVRAQEYGDSATRRALVEAASGARVTGGLADAVGDTRKGQAQETTAYVLDALAAALDEDPAVAAPDVVFGAYAADDTAQHAVRILVREILEQT